jgi:O-acetylhomoserine (thiol)-lyase
LFPTQGAGVHVVEWATAIPQMFGAQLAFVIRARVVVLRDQGGAITPTNSFNFIQGLETLPLRLKQHNENAIQVAEFLKSHKAVSKVIFPKFHEGENKKRTEKYYKNGFGSLVGIELSKGIEAGKAFINALELHYHVANIGDARSLAIHPASTTHSQLTEEEQLQTGVTPGYVRLSVGLEHPEDIIADLKKGLEAAVNAG